MGLACGLPRPRKAETACPGNQRRPLSQVRPVGPILLYNPNATRLSEWLRSTPRPSDSFLLRLSGARLPAPYLPGGTLALLTAP